MSIKRLFLSISVFFTINAFTTTATAVTFSGDKTAIVVEDSIITIDSGIVTVASGTYQFHAIDNYAISDIGFFTIIPFANNQSANWVFEINNASSTVQNLLEGVEFDTIFALKLNPNDPHSPFSGLEFAFRIIGTNEAPIADAGPDQSVNGNTLITLDASASYDSDNNLTYDNLSYEWSQNRLGTHASDPEVLVYGGSAKNPIFVAPNQDVTLLFNLTVYDHSNVANSASQIASVQITVQAINAISLQPVFGQTYTAGVIFDDNNAVILPEATNPISTSTITYAIDGLPTGLLFAPSDRVIIGIPTTAGIYPITYTATDDSGNASQTFTLTVQLGINPATINLIAFTEQATDLTLPEAVGATGDVIYTLQGKLPTHLSYDPSTRKITGTTLSDPISGGFVLNDPQYPITYTMTDSATPPNVLTISATLQVVHGIQFPQQKDITVVTGEEQNIFLKQANWAYQNTTYSISGLPTGFSYSASSNKIYGTTSATAGVYPLTYSVTDANTTLTQIFNINVTATKATFPGGYGNSDQGGSITEDAATNTISKTFPAISDTDTDPISGVSEAQFKAVSNASIQYGYGIYSITAAGVWTYTLDNTHPEVNALNIGDTLTDSFEISSFDGSSKILITITINGANDTPIANAGNDQINVAGGTSITLDGSNSYDPDAGETYNISYVWSQVSGPSVTLTDTKPAHAHPGTQANTFVSFIAPTTPSVSLVFSLVVTDNNGASSTADQVTISTGTPATEDDFITIWRTVLHNSSITIPTISATNSIPNQYNYNVDCDYDGIHISYDFTAQTADTTCEYAAAGDYTVVISGDFPRIYINNTGDKHKIISIEQWGSTQWNSMKKAFYGAINLRSNATDTPDLSMLTSTRNMFRNTTVFDQDLGDWNMSTVTDVWNMLNSSGLSIANYDATLIGWAMQDLVNELTLHADGLIYSNAAKTARDKITASVANGGDSWTIKYDNGFPTSHAGANQSAIAGTTVSLNGTMSSDPDNDPITYAWSQIAGPSVTLNYATIAVPTFTAPSNLTADITLKFTLTITDNISGGSDTDIVVITITPAPIAASNNDFIFTFSGTSFAVPIIGTGYNYSIACDYDNSGSVIYDAINQTGSYTCSGLSDDVHIVVISGDFPRIYFNNTGDKAKIRSIEQWGTGAWTSMQGAFYGASNLISNATDKPDLANVTNMIDMFHNATAFNGDAQINSWNTAGVTDMTSVFFGATAFNQDINGWNISAVTSFASMFRNATSFNQNLNNWNTTSATNMANMFWNAAGFNGNISGWATNSVVSFINMFRNASVFNQNISAWNTTAATTMENMFTSAAAFDQNLGDWNMALVNNVNSMLSHSGLSINNYNTTLIGWGGQNLISNRTLAANNLTYSASGKTARDAIIADYNWTITGDNQAPALALTAPAHQNYVVDMAITDLILDVATNIIGAETYTVSNLPAGLSFDATNRTISGTPSTAINSTVVYTVTDSLESADVSFNISVTTPAPYSADAFVSTWSGAEFTIPTTGSGYNYSIDCDYNGTYVHYDASVTSGYTCSGLSDTQTHTVVISGDFPQIYFNNTGDKNKILSIEQWGSGQWSSMQGAFYGATNLVSNATDKPDLANVTNMIDMFHNATAFNGDAQINSWNTENVTNMTSVFFGATAFNQDISGWDISAVINFASMFRNATSFNQNLNNWNTTSATNMANMFWNATAFNGDISGWATNSVVSFINMFRDASSFNQDISAWNTAAATTMENMFTSAAAFDQNLGNWNMESVNDVSNMLSHSGLSINNYDATLIGWTAQDLVNNLTFGADGLVYSAAGRIARNSIIVDDVWTFSGDESTFDLDIDNDNSVSAGTDGVLIIRYLLNPNAAVIDTNGITFADNASRTTATAILDYLNVGKQDLDIDDDGKIEAATDGVLILNFMLNPTTLNITDAVGDNANRTSTISIKTYLQTLNP